MSNTRSKLWSHEKTPCISRNLNFEDFEDNLRVFCDQNSVMSDRNDWLGNLSVSIANGDVEGSADVVMY